MPKVRKSERLPPSGASMALAVHRLEKISRAIRKTFVTLSARPPGDFGHRVPLEAYVHFRSKAFRLLGHYMDAGLEEAFEWSLRMKGIAPKRKRGDVADNAFYWGLRAMSGAAGDFMSRNKLRDLARGMKTAYDAGLTKEDLELCLRADRKGARRKRYDAELAILRSENPHVPEQDWRDAAADAL